MKRSRELLIQALVGVVSVIIWTADVRSQDCEPCDEIRDRLFDQLCLQNETMWFSKVCDFVCLQQSMTKAELEGKLVCDDGTSGGGSAANCAAFINGTITGLVTAIIADINCDCLTGPAVTIFCPEPAVVECDESIDPSNTGIATALARFDPSPQISFGDEEVAGFFLLDLLIDRTWTAIDFIGNSDSCIQLIVVQDTSAPLITCPEDVSLTCGQSTDPEETGGATASDNCSANPGISFGDNVLPGCGVGSSVTVVRTWTASDGKTLSNCDQILTIIDDLAPVLSCPPDITIACGESIDLAVTGTATAADSCSADPIPTAVDETIADCGASGQITRTWTAIDACGNAGTCVQEITIRDATAPTVSCPPDVTIEASDDTAPGATGLASAADECGAVTVTFTDSTTSGSSGFPMITRAWLGTDACGNSSSCEQQITIADNTPPSISCPADVEIECEQSTDSVYTGVPTVSDNTDPAPDIDFSDISEATGGPPVTIARIWTATDNSGNSVDCVQTITLLDFTLPEIQCPADTQLADCTDLPDSVIVGLPSVSDNCGVAPVVDFVDVFGGGGATQQSEIFRIWTTVDASGNFVDCVQIIMVTDTTSPVLETPPDVTIDCRADNSPAATGTATAVDACGGPVEIFHHDTVIISGCGSERTIERTWTAIDLIGNQATAAQIIDVTDSIAPFIRCPPDVALAAGESAAPANIGIASATDNCGIPPELGVVDTVVEAEGGATIMREWSATDACGNQATCTQTITVPESTAPTAVCRNITVGLGIDGTVVITATDVDDGSSDAEDGTNVTLAVDSFSFDCSYLGDNTVILTVTDSTGLTDTCQATVTVTDPPGICTSQVETDFLDSIGEFGVTLFGVEDLLVIVAGPTVIQRGPAATDVGTGLVTIPTEILSMDLTGDTEFGPVRVHTNLGDERPPTTGKVLQTMPDSFFPAESFFNVFVNIDVYGETLTTHQPIRVQTTIAQLPPYGETYANLAGEPSVELIDRFRNPVGEITSVRHIIVPPTTPPEICQALGYSTLTFMHSASDETGPDDETSEAWVERTGEVFVTTEEDNAPSQEYLVRIVDGIVANDPLDTPQIGARYANGSKTSNCQKCDKMCGPVSPSYNTGTKYGSYTKEILPCSGSQMVEAQVGYLDVARIDANGIDNSTTTDQFSPYACVLPKRTGRLTDCQPVIIIESGGEKVITASPPVPDKGTQTVSFYGVVCNQTNRWNFKAKDDGFEAAKQTRKWYKQQGGGFRTEFGGAAADPGPEEFDSGRWNVILEYTDRATGAVIAKAEIHSLVVESIHTDNVPFSGPVDAIAPGAIGEPLGSPFELRAKCAPDILVDGSVFVQKASNGARGRVSLDGYPQNEYWGGSSDAHDMPQVLALLPNSPERIYLQGYEKPTAAERDLTLITEGQAFIEDCDGERCESQKLEWFGTPVIWRWEFTDREPFSSIQVDLEIAEVKEPEEECLGVLVALNDDFDEGNMETTGSTSPNDKRPTEDNKPDITAGHRIKADAKHDNVDGGTAKKVADVNTFLDDDDNELADTKFIIRGPVGLKGKWKTKLENSGTGELKVWEHNGSAWVEVMDDMDSAEIALDESGGKKTIPLKLEGIKVTETVNEITLTASFTPTIASRTGATLVPCKDPAKISVIDVEIFVNFPVPTRGNDLTDDYITWAPTKCEAKVVGMKGRKKDLTVLLNNDLIVDTKEPANGGVTPPDPERFRGGRMLFAYEPPDWPVETTSEREVLPLDDTPQTFPDKVSRKSPVLKADGTPVKFRIAGKFGRPSFKDKDTIIDAHQDDANGRVFGNHRLMVRIRKDGNKLQSFERDLFIAAVDFLNDSGEFAVYNQIHGIAASQGDEAHGFRQAQPAFAPWHRALMLQFERALQALPGPAYDPNRYKAVALTYHNWDAAAPNIFHKNFMGENSAGAGVGTPDFTPANPLAGFNTQLTGIYKNIQRARQSTNDATVAPGVGTFRPLASLLTQTRFGKSRKFLGPDTPVSFSLWLEQDSHNPGHYWNCQVGHLISGARTAADPIFFLLHCQVDRQWAAWQRRHKRFGTPDKTTKVITFKAPEDYDNTTTFNPASPVPANLNVDNTLPAGAAVKTADVSKTNCLQLGSHLNDIMWPWGVANASITVANANADPRDNRPVGAPDAMFAKSKILNLWPTGATTVKVRNMIDYLGRAKPEDGLGFSYDDVPYKTP